MLETKLKPFGVLCLILGLSLVASAANVDWTGANSDANGLGYWDIPGNWATGALPTSGDNVVVQRELDTRDILLSECHPSHGPFSFGPHLLAKGQKKTCSAH